MPIEIVIGGGAAGILADELHRSTLDIDVIGSSPKTSSLKTKIKAFGIERGIGDRWLNDAAKGFSRYLPDDFRGRLRKIDGGYQNLRVWVLGKPDLYVMKPASFRPVDRIDLSEMMLTAKEVQVVMGAVARIAAFDGKTAYRMDLYLKETGALNGFENGLAENRGSFRSPGT